MEIIVDIVQHLENRDSKLKENCALAIYKCAVNKVTRDMVRESGGLDPLCRLVQDKEVFITQGFHKPRQFATRLSSFPYKRLTDQCNQYTALIFIINYTDLVLKQNQIEPQLSLRSFYSLD
jgi:hypothetical protein